MPETRQHALHRASRLGFAASSVIKAKNHGGYFIAPHGVTSTKAKHAYAN